MKPALDDKLRAWWSHRQALDGRLAGVSSAEVLEQTGWARSVAGVGPYLTLFQRAGISRQDTDSAVQTVSIHELPAARGCTYVVPAHDFALALRAGQSFSGAALKVAYKLGVTDQEIEKLCDVVLSSLSQGPLDPEAIREVTGDASRKLGEEGKKKGISTTLPLALGKLQSAGEIRRISLNGRLDQQRYAYALWRPNPLAGSPPSAEEINRELARRYFSWTGPATITEFQWFSGLTVKACKAAVEALRLENVGDDRFLFPADREAFEAFQVPKQAQYVLVSSIDGIALLRRNLKSLIAASDLNSKAFGDKGPVALNGLSDLPNHAIFDRGRLVGLWEYDTATEAIAWTAFVQKNKDLEAAVKRTEEFVRTQLGDARSFSLDSPKSRIPRIEALRQANA